MSLPTATVAAAPAPATGAAPRRVPLKRCYAFYDLRTASARRVPLTRQFTFTNVLDVPGAFNGAAAPAQTRSAAWAQQPSAGLGNAVAALLSAPAKRKHDHSDNDDHEAGDAKRRRVEPNAQPPSRAAGGTTGTPASASPTGATATTHYHSTAAAAPPSAARNALKTPTKPAGTGKALRGILKMPRSAARSAPSTTRRVRFAALPSAPPQSLKTKRGFGSIAGPEDE